MIEKQIVVDGLLTRYETVGTKGRAILLLHGWGDTSKTFHSLANELGKGDTVYCLNLPGFGGTDSPSQTWGLTDYASFVGMFVQKINLEVNTVIGHSNGGAIALRAIATNKINPRKLVLLSSAGIRDVYKGKKKMLRIAAKAGKVLTKPLPKRTQEKLKRKAYNTVGSDLFVAEHLQDTFKKVVTDDVQADAEHIHVPTLLIYGTNDEATPPQFGQLFAEKIEGAQLEIVENAGHFIHHDAAERVNKLVEDFIQ